MDSSNEKIDKNKSTKREYLLVRKTVMTLTCEWENCLEVFETMEPFLAHITEHLEVVKRQVMVESGEVRCEWRNCNQVAQSDFKELARHVYFHGFHIKLKNFGMNITLKKKLMACAMCSDSRNIIPDLPESFHCGWKYCEVVSDNPYYFYEHVKSHAKEYPGGRKPLVNCKCEWEGCDLAITSQYKLTTHLRSHTQEKIVACPICGSLFSTTTKYEDHLKRQEDLNAQSFQCSHCSKRYPSERLLKDHIRKHVNNYKCPFCEMTTPCPSTLRSHMLYRHSDERNFACSYCDASFKTNSDRQRHINTKHGDNSYYICTETNCNFKSKHDFEINAHVRFKHSSTGKEPAYVCDTCNKRYTRGHTLTTHLRKHHNLQPLPGHKSFGYKLGDDGNYHLQTVRYESYELTQKLKTDRYKKSLAGLKSDIEKIKVKNKSKNGEGVKQSKNQQINGAVDVLQKSPTKSCVGVSKDEDELSYNLTMLGDVAVQEQRKEASQSAYTDSQS